MLKQLLEDAQPKADAIKQTAANTVKSVNNSNVVQAARKIGYKGLVNTVGVALVLAKPVTNKFWANVQKLAESK